jgi:hypothetical protein
MSFIDNPLPIRHERYRFVQHLQGLLGLVVLSITTLNQHQ